MLCRSREYKRVADSREHFAPIVHRVKEVTVPTGMCRFPARHDRDRLVRDIPVLETETGGGEAPTTERIEPEEHGPTGEYILFLPDDLSPPTVDPDGVEI